MNTSVFGNLRELVGVWSCLVFIMGVGAIAFCHFSRTARDLKLPRAIRAKISGNLAMAMLLASLLIAFFVAPGSMTYSGPVPSELRHLWLYDKYFAALIALVFAADLAFSWFRVWKGVR